mgnify:CR=1 FL=1
MIFLNDNDKLSYSFLKKNAHKCYVLLSNGHVTDFSLSVTCDRVSIGIHVAERISFDYTIEADLSYSDLFKYGFSIARFQQQMNQLYTYIASNDAIFWYNLGEDGLAACDYDFKNVLWLPVATWTMTGKKDT